MSKTYYEQELFGDHRHDDRAATPPVKPSQSPKVNQDAGSAIHQPDSNQTVSKVKSHEQVGDLFRPTQAEEILNPTTKDIAKKPNIKRTQRSRVGAQPSAGASGPMPHLLTLPTDLHNVAGALAANELPIALDIETYGQSTLDPWRGEIRLLSLAIPGHEPWLLDLKALGYVLGPLKSILERRLIIGHRIKFDALWLRQKCDVRIAQVFCTCTAGRLLTAGRREANDLGECLYRYLNLDIPKDQARSDWGTLFLSAEQLRYASEDVAHLHALKTKLSEALDQAQLTAVAQLEMELLPVVVDMEINGIQVDRAILQQLLVKAQAEADRMTLMLNQELGVSVNLNSPQQLQQALARKGLQLPDTREGTLAASNHSLVGSLLQYRAAKKQVEQTEALLQAVQSDGRIHALFEPTGTATGRFSSSNPNLQNVVRGEMRSAFVAPPGHVLIVADYSQIELRAAAVIANEAKMIEAFKRGEDLHKQTASLVLDKPISDVTKEDRQLAKAVNFGLLYGQSPKGLVSYAKTNYGVELTEQQAATIRDKFFKAYAGLKSWHNRAWNEAKANATEIRTLIRRRRWLPQGADENWRRFTGLVNTIVQGSCADGMKQAILDLARQLPEAAKIVSTVHDELIVEAAFSQAESVQNLVKQCMIQPMAKLFSQVPIVVDVKICQHWGEK